MRKSVVLFVVLIVIAGLSCHKGNPVAPSNGEGSWIPLGLAGKEITRLRTSPSYIYACAGLDGLYRLSKSSSGDSWEYIGLADTALIGGIDTTKGGNVPTTQGVVDVAVNPSDENEILAAVLVNKPNIPGIYKTTNGGVTWFEADSGYGFLVDCQDNGTIEGVGLLYCLPGRFNTLYAATPTDGYLYRSTNAGADWGAWPIFGAGIHSVASIAPDPSDPEKIYVGTYLAQRHCSYEIPHLPVELYTTANGGNSWSLRFPDPTDLTDGISNISITQNPPAIYLVVGPNVLGSRDNGSTWQKLVSTDDSSWTPALVVDPSNDSCLLAASGSWFVKSDDAGATWTKSDIPENIGGNIGRLIWDKGSGNLYAVDGGGFNNQTGAYANRGIFVLPKASPVLFKK